MNKIDEKISYWEGKYAATQGYIEAVKELGAVSQEALDMTDEMMSVVKSFIDDLYEIKDNYEK